MLWRWNGRVQFMLDSHGGLACYGQANIRVCNMLSVQLWEVLKIPQRMAAAGAAEGEQQRMVHAEALPATDSSLNQSGVMPKLSLRWG